MKKFCFVIFIAVILALFSVRIFVDNGRSSDFSSLSVKDISLYENTFSTTVNHLSSGSSIRDYSYAIDNSSLYITVYSGLVTRKYPSGTLNIKFTDPQLSDVKAVYLQDGSLKKLIYPIDNN